MWDRLYILLHSILNYHWGRWYHNFLTKHSKDCLLKTTNLKVRELLKPGLFIPNTHVLSFQWSCPSELDQASVQRYTREQSLVCLSKELDNTYNRGPWTSNPKPAWLSFCPSRIILGPHRGVVWEVMLVLAYHLLKAEVLCLSDWDAGPVLLPVNFVFNISIVFFLWWWGWGNRRAQ